MRVGPSEKSKGGLIEWSHYPTGETAMTILGPKGVKIYLPTIRPPKHIDLVDDDHVWLKDFAGAEGCAEALVAAGVVTLTGVKVALGGGAHAIQAALTLEAKAARDASKWRAAQIATLKKVGRWK